MMVAVTRSNSTQLRSKQWNENDTCIQGEWVETEKKELTQCVCVCLLVSNHVHICIVLLLGGGGFCLSVCSFICPSVGVSVNLAVCSVHLCWVWTASAECFLCKVCFPLLWLGKYSSVWIWVPALWGLIIPNTVKSAKHAPRVDANQIYDPVQHTLFYSL